MSLKTSKLAGNIPNLFLSIRLGCVACVGMSRGPVTCVRALLSFSAFSQMGAGRVLDAAALIMRAVASGGDNAAAPMREAALTEGAMLHHLAVGMSGAGVRFLPPAHTHILDHSILSYAFFFAF